MSDWPIEAFIPILAAMGVCLVELAVVFDHLASLLFCCSIWVVALTLRSMFKLWGDK